MPITISGLPASTYDQNQKVSLSWLTPSHKYGETCIDCHKGIAHKLPAGYDDDEDEDD